MSTRWKGNITDRGLAAEELENPRTCKRRRDDDVSMTLSHSSRVSSTKKKGAKFGDLEQETFRFDRIRPTEVPTAESRTIAPTESSKNGTTFVEMLQEQLQFDTIRSPEVPIFDNRATAPLCSATMGSFQFPLNESCSLESLQRLLELPRFAKMPQQPSIFQALHPDLSSIFNSVSSLPGLGIDMPLNQFQIFQDLSRAHQFYEANSLGAFQSSLRGNSPADPFNGLSLQAQRTSLALMPHVRNTLGNSPSGNHIFVDGKRSGSFVLAQSLGSVQNVSTVAYPRTHEGSFQSQGQDNEDCNPIKLTLYISDDDGKLNENQIFLRRNVELFRASENDILCITRGENKPIVLYQVGIRCCHCSHVAAGRRKKGSTYFPSNLIGLYQAVQNLSVEHLQSGLCTELPPDVKERFSRYASRKKSGRSGAGKMYWAEAGRRMGLIDTDDGIRFASDRVDFRQPRAYSGQRPVTDK